MTLHVGDAVSDKGADTAASIDEPRIPITVEGALGATVMGTMCILTFVNVCTRYFTNISLAFTEEVSVALMVVLAFGGAAAAFARGLHLRMGALADMAPLVWRLRLELLTMFLSGVLFAVITYYGVLLAWDEHRFNIGSSGLDVPQWWYTMWLPILSLVICARIAGRMSRILRRLRMQGPSC